MRRIRWTFLALITVALFVPAAAEEATVGSFLQRLAQAKGLAASDGPQAIDALHAAGIQIPYELVPDLALNEGHVAQVSRALGLNVSTNRPTKSFSSQQVDRFFATFQVEMALDGAAPRSPQAAGVAVPFDPYLKGKGGSKGKKRGREHTPREPE